MADEEPPALSSSSGSAAPPPSAFSSSGAGGPPPAAAFSHSNAAPAAASSDLNSRWKQYETEMEQRKASEPPKKEAHENYDLYETPEKFRRSNSSAASQALTGSSRQLYSGNEVSNESLEPRRSYSFNKSSSYDTNALIAKYAGVSGVSGVPPSAGPQRTLSNASQSSASGAAASRRAKDSSTSSSVLPSTARAEALQVLSMADEQMMSTNQPFHVRRTESGGFRASAMDPSELKHKHQQLHPHQHQPSGYGMQRSTSNSRRTPSALSGLGLGSGGSSSSKKPVWKAGRYSFRDPQFRDDDYLAEEEDEIIGTVAADEFQDEVEMEIYDASKGRRGRLGSKSAFEDVAFEGDFPGKSGAGGIASPPRGSNWSSRYSDNPKMTNAQLLDRYDRSHASKQQSASGRQSARNMFMSTASNVGDSVRSFGGSVSSRLSEAASKANSGTFGKGGGFSFKASAKAKANDRKNQSSPTDGLPGSPYRPSASASATGSTNLRTVWKDSDSIDDDDNLMDGSGKQHKTWEQVMLGKKRRRTLALSILCALVAILIVGVSLWQTSWRWKYKNLWGNGNTQLEVTFYATSNTPLGFGANEEQLVQDLANLPGDADFVAHLGNLQDASVNMCPSARMPEVAALLNANLPVPLFIVPGEHDWIRCPNQLTALARWMDAFATTPLEEDAASDDDYTAEPAIAALQALEFDRPKTSPEIFSKLQNGVLVIGLHLVHGTVTDGMGMQEQVVRDEKMAIFVRGTLDRLAGQYRAVVLLGNARPGPRQRAFFDAIADAIGAAGVPTAYVHANAGSKTVSKRYPFGERKKRGSGRGLSGMVAIEVPSGGNSQPPARITVGFGRDMFRVG